MNTNLSDLKQDLSDLMQNYIKLQSQLSITRQVNNKLKDCIISLTCQYWINSQCSRRECLEICSIPNKTLQKDLEDKALNILENEMLILISKILRTVAGNRARDTNA